MSVAAAAVVAVAAVLATVFLKPAGQPSVEQPAEDAALTSA